MMIVEIFIFSKSGGNGNGNSFEEKNLLNGTNFMASGAEKNDIGAVSGTVMK